MTANVLKHIKGSKQWYFLEQDSTCKFSGQFLLSRYKTTLKQQLNGEKRCFFQALDRKTTQLNQKQISGLAFYFYAVVRQISMLFVDNKISVFCIPSHFSSFFTVSLLFKCRFVA